jgi:hypothetical protein
MNNLSVTVQDLINELASVRVNMTILKWMVAANLALTVAVFWKVFG